jgi:hypothetical protein
MMGSVRGEADEQRLDGLKKLAQELGVHVSLKLSILPADTRRTMSSSSSTLRIQKLFVVLGKAQWD